MEVGLCGWLKIRPSCVSSVYLVIFLIWSKCASLRAESCSTPDYDIKNLTNAWYWYYNSTDKNVCPSNSGSCQFIFSICKVLPFDCQDCSVAVNSTENNITIIGEYNNTTNPINPGNREFTIFYTQSILKFNCDLSARWIPEIGNTSSPVPVSANTSISVQPNSLSDIYTFEFKSAEACGIPPTVKPFEPKVKSLSTGSILLLIFFPTVALYFLLGMILNKLGGAHGKELVPNYEFWNSLPGLIADGVVFTWSMITCQGSKGVSGYDSI
ncbi:cation-dependent mannose-6-phosphate receptor-like [Anneissia japonica]|uniref:cation-dependent mannose-6-phosphate receptor-like n=1 Tax=Anneissia japonica TaxID=1529436 RepID=UPI0014256E59|nr:cation-dependent mannose-6-phosphate receptor-like [Anneissia japonica]